MCEQLFFTEFVGKQFCDLLNGFLLIASVDGDRQFDTKPRSDLQKAQNILAVRGSFVIDTGKRDVAAERVGKSHELCRCPRMKAEGVCDAQFSLKHPFSTSEAQEACWFDRSPLCPDRQRPLRDRAAKHLCYWRQV